MQKSHVTRTLRMPAWLAWTLILALVVALIPFAPVRAQQERSSVFFDRTGQTVSDPFFEAWRAQGGLAQAGEPISPLVQVDGRWVQWFQFTRLEVAKPDLAEASDADVRTAPIGRAVAEGMGLTRLHPAFQPFEGRVQSGVRLYATGHSLANGFLQTYDRNDVGARLGPPISEEFSVNGTVYQFFERGALSWSPDFGVNFVPLGFFDAALSGHLRLSGDRPEGVPSYEEEVPALAPAGGSGERWIDVNLSTYTLTAFEGGTPVYSSPIVDGAPGTPTVRGTFYIYWKLESQTMRGPNADGSEYVTEDVPWVMYFYADFALHGAYWRSSFGYSGSHGCVNMPVGDAAWLYGWAGYGTRVEVHD
jgi:hypothetical protein